MRRCKLVYASLVFVASISLAAASSAATIGFEGVVGGDFVVPVTPYVEAGFTLTNSLGSASDSDGIFSPSFIGGVNNGTDNFGWCGGCHATNPLVITLTPNAGTPFSLISFEAGNLVAGQFTSGEQIIVTGNLAGGGSVVQTVTLVQDTLTLFTLGAGFTNLTSVEFVGSLAPAGSHLAMDNLVVTTPEPSTALLVGGGLLFLAAQRRRRRD